MISESDWFVDDELFSCDWTKSEAQVRSIARRFLGVSILGLVPAAVWFLGAWAQHEASQHPRNAGFDTGLDTSELATTAFVLVGLLQIGFFWFRRPGSTSKTTLAWWTLVVLYNVLLACVPALAGVAAVAIAIVDRDPASVTMFAVAFPFFVWFATLVKWSWTAFRAELRLARLAELVYLFDDEL